MLNSYLTVIYLYIYYSIRPDYVRFITCKKQGPIAGAHITYSPAVISSQHLLNYRLKTLVVECPPRQRPNSHKCNCRY